MTTHETDRPADDGSVEENDQIGGSDHPTDEPYEPRMDTDADVADAELNEPVEKKNWGGGGGGGGEKKKKKNEAEDAETEPKIVDPDAADEPAEPELADEPDRIDPVAVDRTSESDPLQRSRRLAPTLRWILGLGATRTAGAPSRPG